MTSSFSPSPEQLAFRAALESTKDNIILEAVAGSGKTTTIVWGTGFIPQGYSVRFLAFNKNIQRELASRLPHTVDCCTFHSVGYAAWRRAVGRRMDNPDPDKLKKLMKQRFTGSEFGLMVSPVCRLVSYAKNAGLGTPAGNGTTWRSLAVHHSLDFGEADEDEVYSAADRLLSASNEIGDKVIDFDDMLYLPLLHNVPFDKTSYVFIDEAQDTNSVQRALLHRLVAQRLIAVGDPMQAIYGFRGADADALDKIREEFNALTLPLSVSYRCSQAVVKEAQKFYNT